VVERRLQCKLRNYGWGLFFINVLALQRGSPAAGISIGMKALVPGSVFERSWNLIMSLNPCVPT